MHTNICLRFILTWFYADSSLISDWTTYASYIHGICRNCLLFKNKKTNKQTSKQNKTKNRTKNQKKQKQTNKQQQQQQQQQQTIDLSVHS